jgi:hypothetical protein
MFLLKKYFCSKNIFARKIFLPETFVGSNDKQIWTEGPKIAAEGCL